MAVQIGVRTPAGGVLELLLECHQRIRAFTALARRLAASPELDAREAAEAAGAVRRYFAEALPLHAADEEESVAPLLQGRDPALDGALAVMRREHADHGPRVDRVVALCAEIAALPGRLARLSGPLAEASEELERHFACHLALEEETIFPALKRALDPLAEARMAAQMRARRAA